MQKTIEEEPDKTPVNRKISNTSLVKVLSRENIFKLQRDRDLLFMFLEV